MPVLKSAVRVGGHQSVSKVVFIGIVGQSSYWGVIVAFQNVLHIFSLIHGLLWVDDSIFINPLEHPAAM